MGKETKIGLAVIGSLLLVFSFVLYQRLIHWDEGPTAAAVDESASMATGKDAGSQSSQPTVVTPVAAASDPPADRSASGRRRDRRPPIERDTRSEASAGDAESAEPTPSFMPEPDHAAAADGPRDRYARRRATAGAAGPAPGSSSGAADDSEGASADAESASLASDDEDPAPLRFRSADDITGRANDAAGAAERANRLRYRPRPSAPARLPDDRTVDESTPLADEAAEEPLAAEPNEEPAEAADESLRPEPVDGSDDERRHVVVAGDSYWTISRQRFGTGGYFRALYEHNRARFPHPDDLSAGDVIDVPPAAELEEMYPQLCPAAVLAADETDAAGSAEDEAPATSADLEEVADDPAAGEPAEGEPTVAGRYYIVQEEETIFDIARYELGKAARWAEIYELNRELIGDDFDHLYPGLRLLLPGAGPATAARRGTSRR